MKQISCCIGWSFLFLQGAFASAAVTYTFSGGRFGDNLMAYLHAKWISYEYQIPLLYQPFPLSSELQMDDKELSYKNESINFVRYLTLGPQVSKPMPDKNVLYICPYFPECAAERKDQPWFYYPVNWKNPAFRELAKAAIAPKSNLPLMIPPKNGVSIALHLRHGGGYDRYERYFLENPLKIPPLSFYVTALKEVLSSFEHSPIYCHIFTDAENPSLLLEEIQSHFLSVPHLHFSCRRESNRHDQNVLEDFFSLFYFDVLIRPESNYSLIPDLLSDYAMVVSPSQFKMDGQVLTIHEMKVEKDPAQCQKVLDRIFSDQKNLQEACSQD